MTVVREPDVAVRPRSLARGLVSAARPRQWIKNLLVFAAPAASGRFTDGDVLLAAVGAFLAYCMTASGVYFLNDVRDVVEDRLHPRKRYRAIAAGSVPRGLASVFGVLLLALGLGVAAVVEVRLLVVLGAYLAITTAYTYGLKLVPVVELAVVASGFILRAVAGGVAADVAISAWFVIVTSFGSLFMVAGKRQGEFMHLGEARSGTRRTLGVYTLGYLRFVWSLAAAVTVAAYCLWAFENAAAATSPLPLHQLSIAPFVVAVLTYALVIETGEAGAPEEVVLGNRTLQVLSLVWLVLYGAAVYAA